MCIMSPSIIQWKHTWSITWHLVVSSVKTCELKTAMSSRKGTKVFISTLNSIWLPHWSVTTVCSENLPKLSPSCLGAQTWKESITSVSKIWTWAGNFLLQYPSLTASNHTVRYKIHPSSLMALKANKSISSKLLMSSSFCWTSFIGE